MNKAESAIEGLMDDIRDQKYLLRHMMKTKLEIKISLLRDMNMGIISHGGGGIFTEGLAGVNMRFLCKEI